MKKTNKVLLVGGTFDPIHNGHIAIIKEAQLKLKIENVWIMIDPYPADKTPVASINHRLNMAELVALNNNWRVSKLEIINKEGNSDYSTIDSINSFTESFPFIDFYFLIGSDQLENFQKWRKYEEIVSKVKLVVAPREGYPISKKDLKLYNAISLKSFKLLKNQISSSNIRDTFNIKDIPYVIKDYIIKNKIYQ